MNNVIENLSSYSFKDIKEEISKINIEDNILSEEVENIIKLLKADKRKNVISLGERIQKQKDKYIAEVERVKNMYSFDKSFGNYKYVCGVDEVGRGPLAGPIVAAAVILDLNVLDNDLILGLNDSKKLSESKRIELSKIIKEKAIAYKIELATNEEIDNEGIAVCNNKIFLNSCYGLSVKPDLVLSDGYLVKNIKIANKSVVKGDAKSASIAAASIIAKVYRDELMKEYAKEYPHYGFEENVGYGTSKHIKGIKEVGTCKIHRKSFLRNLLNDI